MKKLILVFIAVVLVFNFSYSQQLRTEHTWRVPVMLGSRAVVDANDSLFVALRACGLRVPKGIGEIATSRKCNFMVAGKKTSDIEYSVKIFGWSGGTELEVYARWSGEYQLLDEVRKAVLNDIATHCSVPK